MRLNYKIVVFMSMFCSLQAYAVEPDFVGEWEVTTHMEMMGMSMPGQTVKHCVTKDDLVMTPDVGKDCKLIDHHINSNTITWHMTCTLEGQEANIDGKVAYVGDTMESTINIHGLGMTMVNHGVGKRLGDCK